MRKSNYGLWCAPFDPSRYAPRTIERVVGDIKEEIEQLEGYSGRILSTIWKPTDIAKGRCCIIEERDEKKSYLFGFLKCSSVETESILEISGRREGILGYLWKDEKVKEIAEKHLNQFKTKYCPRIEEVRGFKMLK